MGKKLIPYNRQYIDSSDIKAITETLKSDYLTGGSKVVEFEELIADYTDKKYAISFNSATSGLYALATEILCSDDVVLTTANSFVATSNAILKANAKVKFIDIDDNGNLDLDLCEKYIKFFRVKAIFIVAFGGVMYDITRLNDLKKRYNLIIVEDLAHAFGSLYSDGKVSGNSLSDASVFSFHAIKNITTAEGGMVVTDNLELCKKLRLARSHYICKDDIGNPWEYSQVGLGENYRMSDISASLGISQFKKLDIFKQKRLSLVKYYHKKLSDLKSIKILHDYNENYFYHLFVILIEFKTVSKKDFFIKMREKYNISLQVNYIPIYTQPYYKKLLGDIKLDKTEEYYSRAVSMPLFYTLSYTDIDYIVDSIRDILDD